MTLLNSFLVRNLISMARSVIEKRPDQAQGWPDFFDNTDGIGGVQRTLFYKSRGVMIPFKGRTKPVPIESKIGIEAHITAAIFGTTRRARKFWKTQILDGIIPADVVAFFGSGFPANDADYHDLVAERMALHARFWKVPYHWVGLQNGDILHNNDVTRYTFHGNGGNGPLIGCSAEAHLPGLEKWDADKRPKKYSDLSEHFILTNRQVIRLATTHSRDLGAPIEILVAHRQYSKGRLGDPGEGWWKEIGIPMSVELHLERRVRLVHGSGHEICREWDPLGQVDFRGRKLAA